MSSTHAAPLAIARPPRRCAPHRGDLLLIEAAVTIGHRLDVLLRAGGVHVFPVRDLAAADSAAQVFAFAAALVECDGTMDDVDRAVAALRAAPGLRGAVLFASAPVSHPTPHGTAILLPRPLSVGDTGRRVLGVLDAAG